MNSRCLYRQVVTWIEDGKERVYELHFGFRALFGGAGLAAPRACIVGSQRRKISLEQITSSN